MNNEQEINQVLTKLRDPHTIRTRAHAILDYVNQDKSPYFILDSERLMSTASFVIDVMYDNYPDLDIPYHSRWRHFETGGIDQLEKIRQQLNQLSVAERGKILYELVIISVFLDAGAGISWRYVEPETKIEYSRSEGLALASLALYQSGVLSNDPSNPLRVDAERLVTFDEEMFRKGFQVTSNNPLEGVPGRVTLLNRLGSTIQQKSQYFGQEGYLGNFYEYISALAINQVLSAKLIFQKVLDAFNSIWPAKSFFYGVSLGDIGKHHALKTNELGSEYIPFHKLSQWLTYSLIEPLEQAGIEVTDLEELTGLSEYRNGGLLIDSQLIFLKNPSILEKAYTPEAEIIVEWRALTVVLLDELADLIRKTLKKNTKELPLVKILQGGTWRAGRQIAKQKRYQGVPPIQIISDGTIF